MSCCHHPHQRILINETPREVLINTASGFIMGFFEVALASANPVRLTKAGGEWLGYLNTLNAGSFSPIAFGQSALPLSHTLSNCRATFDGDVATLTDAVTGRVKYGALFSMKTYPALTDVTLLDALDLPLDIVLTNSFSPIPNNIMVLQAGTPLTFAEVRQYIRKSIDVIVQLGRAEGKRGITEFYLPGS